MKWLQQLWAKFVLQFVTVTFLWITYYILRHLMPKKYRLHDSQIKKYLKDFGLFAQNISKDDDGLGDVLNKSKNLFDYWYDQRNRMNSIEYEFKMLMRDTSEEVDEHGDYSFLNSILPKIESVATSVDLLYEIDGLKHAMKFNFVDPDTEQNVSLYVLKVINERNTDSAQYHHQFGCTKGYNYRKLINMLFKLYDNRLYLTVRRDSLVAEKLNQQFNQENYLTPATLFEKMKNEIVEFRSRGLQRSYVLYGAPGTGKSTFALELSKQVSGKILKVDTKVFTDLSTGETKAVIEGLDCDFIIVDDIDRLTIHDLGAFLYLLESLKDYKNKPTLLASLNSLKRLDPAVLRPGRFDDIVEFELPNVSQRKFFFKKMSAKLDVTISDEEAKALADATPGMSQAFLKEYCLQLQLEKDVGAVLQKIKKRQKYLNQIGDTSQYEESVFNGEISED